MRIIDRIQGMYGFSDEDINKFQEFSNDVRAKYDGPEGPVDGDPDPRFAVLKAFADFCGDHGLSQESRGGEPLQKEKGSK